MSSSVKIFRWKRTWPDKPHSGTCELVDGDERVQVGYVWKGGKGWVWEVQRDTVSYGGSTETKADAMRMVELGTLVLITFNARTLGPASGPEQMSWGRGKPVLAWDRSRDDPS